MPSPSIDGRIVDVYVTEDPDLSSEVTDYPVEEGSDVSDNIRNLPIQLTVEGVISDTPIGVLAELREGEGLPSNETYELLKEIRESRRLVTVETSLDVYNNMALVSLKTPSNSETGDSLYFTATFKQVRTVSNNRQVLRTLEPRGQRKTKQGNRGGLTFNVQTGQSELFVLGETSLNQDVNYAAGKKRVASGDYTFGKTRTASNSVTYNGSIPPAKRVRRASGGGTTPVTGAGIFGGT